MNAHLTATTTKLLALSLLLCATTAQAQFTLLHSFAGWPYDGREPHYTTLAISGSTLYGMNQGGPYIGTVFKMNTDGSGYSLLHSFARDASDGGNPYGSVTLSGSTLYGMTYQGGDSDNGTVFKMNTDGTGYSLLREFTGGASDGRHPYGSVTLSGSTLYGMTDQGGDSDAGTVFKMNTDGTGFSLLREFAGGAGDGSYPRGDLTLDGSTLYGMTNRGGDSDNGTVFKMNTDGSGFSLLREFMFTGRDGRHPFGSVTLDGSTLYGMSQRGGDGSDVGTVFKMNTDGSGFSLLHSFTGGASDGRYPYGDLTLSGSTLYGMTREGGDGSGGTVFKMNTDGSGFSLLHEFAGVAYPLGSVTLDGSTLYGMTPGGGDSNYGTVFSLVIPEPGTGALALSGLLAVAALRRRRTRR